ncbi:MAG: hypothetical protein ACREJO_17990, partial [Phycisphaerales bacterium]
MALTRARQFALKLQTGEGALATLAAANASVNAKDVSYSLSLGDFERKFDIGSLTRQSFMKGPALLKIKGVFECVGGTAGAKGVWHECLEAAGFLHTAVVSQTFLALTSGTPPAAGTLIGDNATQGSATKLARILKYYDSGGTKKIWYY